ncbi:MAG: hypothetical protein WBJ52_05800 [Methanoregulaceae archaeon]
MEKSAAGARFLIYRYKYLLLFVMVGIFFLPKMGPFGPNTGLDSSWVIGITEAFIQKFQFGSEIVWTYGPLGFLIMPVIHNHCLWKIEVIFLLFIHFLFIISIYFLLEHLSARWFHYLIFIPVFILVLPNPPPYNSPPFVKLFIISPILLFLLYIKRSSNLPFILPATIGFFLALISLIKFDMFLSSLYLILVFVLLSCIIKRDILNGIALSSSYCLSFVFMWFISGQFITNIPGYIIGGIEFTKGYSSAMAISGPFWQEVIGLITILVLLASILYFIIRNEREAILFFIFNAFTLFIAFKSGFVRHDMHVLGFLMVFLVFGAITLVLLTSEFRKCQDNEIVSILTALNSVIVVLLLLSGVFLTPLVFNHNIVSEAPSIKTSIELYGNETYFDQHVEMYKTIIRESYAVKQSMLENIDQTPLDIIPSDIALCWAYDLNWSPRPVIQSYSAYTEYLDGINGLHFSDRDLAPQKILYGPYASIDGRYLLFDEPATFQAVFNNYSFEDRSGGFILLNHSGRPDDEQPEQVLLTETGKLGEAVRIPEYYGQLYGHIDIQHSMFGNIMATLYKPKPLFIKFRMKNGETSPEYRFIPGNAKDGLFLTQYVPDIDTLAWIFQGNLINNVDTITIQTDHPEYYKEDFVITYTGKPYFLSPDIHLVYLPLNFVKTLPEQTFFTSFGTIGTVTKPILFEHSMEGGSQILVENVHLGQNDSLLFDVAMDPKTWSPDKGNGVVFEIWISTNVSRDKIFTEHISPQHNPEERKWNSFIVDLSEYGGETVSFMLSTSPGPDNDMSYDWAWWGDPRIKRGS